MMVASAMAGLPTTTRSAGSGSIKIFAWFAVMAMGSAWAERVPKAQVESPAAINMVSQIFIFRNILRFHANDVMVEAVGRRVMMLDLG